MNAESDVDDAVSRIASAIGEPARARILYALMDNHARTSTELAVVAKVTPSTASAHLNRLREEKLINVLVQGKHRYYSLEGPGVAGVLEGLSVLAGGPRNSFKPNTPNRLRAARTCYDHMAGNLGVALHDRLMTLGWLIAERDDCYDLSPKGVVAFKDLGVDIEATRISRRRFAFGCLDWSERRSHLGGAIGSELLRLAVKRKWVTQDLDSRALTVTSFGKRDLMARFDVQV